MLVFALVRGPDDGWGSPLITGLLIGAVLLLAVFLVAEWRQRDPMLDLTLFQRPAMVGVSLAAFTLAASIFALFLYLTLYIQDDLGYGPLAAGVRFLPITMLAFIVAPIAGKLTVRIQARYLLGTALLLIAIGCLLMATTHASSSWTVLLPGFIVAGIGIGTVNPVLASSAISVVPPERSGMASGANNTFRQVGIATGIAGLGTVFQTQIQNHTLAALGSSAAGQAVVAHGGVALKSALAGGGVRQAMGCDPLGGVTPSAARRLPGRVLGHPRTTSWSSAPSSPSSGRSGPSPWCASATSYPASPPVPNPNRSSARGRGSTDAAAPRCRTTASPGTSAAGDRVDPATSRPARPSPRRPSASSGMWATPGCPWRAWPTRPGWPAPPSTAATTTRPT